jgi:protein SCO1
VSSRGMLVLVTLATFIGAAAVFLHRPSAASLELQSGTVLPQPRPLPEFTLLDQHARPFTRASLGGRWTLLFAGFTHCPDICPATLATLVAVDRRLQDSGTEIRVVFLSLDPARDDTHTLATYVNHFNSRFIGATGELEQIEKLMSALGLAFIRVPHAGDSYTIDHSTALVLIDPYARAAAYFRPPLKADALAADIAPLAAARP